MIILIFVEMSGKPENKAAIEMAIAVLSETFRPAESLDATARKYTTADIAEAIAQTTGQMPSVEVVYEVMTAEGYRYVVDETSSMLRYVWLLKYNC